MKLWLRAVSRAFRRMMNSDQRFVVVLCGCTGTGKSDLGIEIAKAFNGEVISADSMQIYKGLDIATNKVTTEEMQGVPHHMMSFWDPIRSDYNVHNFREEALGKVEEIFGRGKLPIIVGGTSYYAESIIYKNYLIASNTSKQDALRAKLLAENPTNDDLYEHLRRVDAKSAELLHRNNRFRVLRALEIYYATGMTRTEHFNKQKQSSTDLLGIFGRHEKLSGKLRFKNTLLLNLDAERTVLDERLDRRVEKMIARGLREELEAFYDWYGSSFPDEYGIMQSIGLKEFLPYLQLDAETRRSSPEGSKLFTAGCALLKTHTRQYCRRQRNWLYHRILLRSQFREVPQHLTFDTSDTSIFFETVVPAALRSIHNFLNHADLLDDWEPSWRHVIMPPPVNAERMRTAFSEADDYQSRANRIFKCETCQLEIQSEVGWKSHCAGKRHRKMLKV